MHLGMLSKLRVLKISLTTAPSRPAEVSRAVPHNRGWLRWVAAALALGVAMVMASTPLRAQIGTTTDIITGRVTGPDTLSLAGAHVEATSLESGITRNNVTDDQGRYSIVFPDGGGQYVVTVHYLGMAPSRLLLRRLADEDRLVADVRLTATPVRLSAVTVEAHRVADSLSAGAGAIGQVLSRELLDRLGYEGNETAALALITPGVTLMTGADSSLSSIAIDGQAASQTGHLIDGLQAGGASLPREAVKSTSVITSAYDVSTGQYSGGYVEQSTESGTNVVQGSVNSSTPLAPVGDLPARSGVLSQRLTGINVGGNLSGPFRKDHLFGALAVHVMHMSMPSASVYSLSPATLGRLGVAPDSLTRFVQILDAQGMPRPASGPGNTRMFENRQLFGRIDFTPRESQTLTLSTSEYQYSASGNISPLATPRASSRYSAESWRTQLSLTSHLGAWMNDARASIAHEAGGWVSTSPTTAGTVVVSSSQATGGGAFGISTLRFGGDANSTIEATTTIDTKDELSWLSEDGAHRAKIGASLTLTRSTGGVPVNVNGTYHFNSLADLENGTPASFTRTIAPANRASATSDVALYLGDAWRMGPSLQLVYGVRLEHSRFADPPDLNAAAASSFGIRTDQFPEESAVNPRVGFTYFYGARKGKPAVVTIRGGIGMFRSGASQVASLFATARDATGLTDGQSQLTCVGAAVPVMSWNDFTSTSADIPTVCATGLQNTTGSALPNVMAIDPSFRVPRSLRASLGASRQFAKVWSISIDGSASNAYNGTAIRDLNLVAAPRFSLADEANRPVYVAPGAIVTSTGAIALGDSRVVPSFGTVSLATSSLRSEYRSASVSLGRMMPKLSINGSYTRAYSRMQVLGNASGGLFFGSSVATGGDPRVAEWVREPFVPPNQLRVFASYRPRKWMEITPSVFVQSGYAFEPLVSGDVNGDGSVNDRAFVFDPARTADTAVANGMARLLATSSSQIRDCLRSQLGRIARAESCESPPFVSGNISTRFIPPWDGGRFSIGVAFSNVAAGLDVLLHGTNHIHGWGEFAQSDRTLLYVRGFDPATRSFRYAVNERFGVPNANLSYIRQPMQINVVARLSFGGSGSGGAGPMGPMALAHAGVLAGVSATVHADSLRARIAATVPNVFRRVLALNDSLTLSLDSAQMARLRAAGDAYQPRADSMTAAIVAIMNLPVAGSDPATVAKSVRAKSDEANALFRRAVEDLKAILRSDQFVKVPRDVISGTP
jgi:hypothetical protein